MWQEEQEGFLREAELEVERQAAIRRADMKYISGLFCVVFIISFMLTRLFMAATDKQKSTDERLTELEQRVQHLEDNAPKDSER